VRHGFKALGRGATVLAAALLALAVTALVVLAVRIALDEDEDRELAASLAGQLPGDEAVGCTLQERGAWWWCGVEAGPGSGLFAYFRVDRDEDGCWTAERLSGKAQEALRRGAEADESGNPRQRAQSHAGCVGEGEEGATTSGPGRLRRRAR
jgi:hypothetical protein